MSTPRTISFSEIQVFKTCRMKHHWRYDLGLRPNRYSDRITLGTLCHKALELRLIGSTQPLADFAKPETPLFEEEREQFYAQIETAEQIVERHYNTVPGFRFHEIEAVEIPFDLPVPRTTRRIQGRIDTLVQTDGQRWLYEWKFPERFRSEEDVQMSSQLAIYQWAAAQIEKPVVGIIYNQILQKLPAIPKMNQNGSTSRAEIYTDWETYSDTVRSRGDDPSRYADEMIPKLQDKEFWRSYRIYRSPEECEAYVNQLTSVTRDICNVDRRVSVYPCESSIHCGNCCYRDLCLEVARGRSPQHLIDSAFTTRKDRDAQKGETEDATD